MGWKKIRNAKLDHLPSLTGYLHTLLHPEKDTTKKSFQDPQRSILRKPVKSHIETITRKVSRARKKHKINQEVNLRIPTENYKNKEHYVA